MSISNIVANLPAAKRLLLEQLLKKEGIDLTREVIMPRDKSTKPLALSFAQQRLWFIDQLEPANSVYNIPAAIPLGPNLDLNALRLALSEVVRRHEALRTRFESAAGIPRQVIDPPAPVFLPIIDLQHLPEEQRAAAARSLAAAEAARGFDLSTGPLLRVSLLHLDREQHLLLLTMHHIISDGWSMTVLIKEVTTLYTAFRQGRPSPLAELSIQYADYSSWQRQRLTGSYLETELQYWREQLAGAEPVLELPTDRPRPSVRSSRGGGVHFELGAELSAAVRRLSRQQGATPYMLLLAAFQTLLWRYTSQEEVVIGTPVAGRNRVETESLVGFFVNTLVLRTRMRAEEEFGELVRRVREQVLEVQGHQEVPFERLVEELVEERSLSYTPLFQVMFAFNNTGSGRSTEPERVEVKSAQAGSEAEASGQEQAPTGSSEEPERAVKFDLNMALSDAGGRLSGMLEYSADVFEEATVRRMVEHYRNVLRAVTRDAKQRVSQIELLGEDERREIVEGWNQTKRNYPQHSLIHQLIEEQAEATADAEAVACEGQRLSYGELNKRANQLARYLRRQGVGPDVVVGIYMGRSVEMVLALLAVLKAGGAYVPLDGSYPIERLRYMVEDAGIEVVLTQSGFMEQVVERASGGLRTLINIDEEWGKISEESAENFDSGASAENLAYIIYTSGSTGKPKGVMVPHRALTNLVHWTLERYDIQPDDRATLIASNGFDASVWETWPYLAVGASLLIPDENVRAMPRQLSAWLVEQGVTLSFMPTPMVESVMAEAPPVGGALKYLFAGGDRLHSFNEAGQEFKLINIYGPTESTVVTTSAEVGRRVWAGEQPSIGRPMANIQVYVLDNQLQPVPIGVTGHLHIGGAGLARGYLSRPELTAEKFIPNHLSNEGGARLYRTGDLAKYLPSGELEFVGRVDTQVKLRGFRIELGEIEAVLTEHSSVSEAVVVIHEQASGDKRLVAYVVSVPGSEAAVTVAELRGYLKEQLPEYMIPSLFVLLEQMPLTPNGKIDRRSLPAPDAQQALSNAAYVAPRDEAEQLLADIWAEVLGVEQVSVEANFFEIGGHSLLATQIISRVREGFQVEMALQSLFRAPTVRGLSELIGEARAVEGSHMQRIALLLNSLEESLIHLQPAGELSPFFCVHPGNVYSYTKLAQCLGTERPFIGIQASGSALDADPTEQVEILAEQYVGEVRTLQPEGPYFLGGWSIGGLIAFEMSRRLRALGQEVAFVGLIDSSLAVEGEDKPDDVTMLISFAADMGLSTKNLDMSLAQISQLTPNEMLAEILQQGKQSEVLPAGFEMAELVERYELFNNKVTAMMSYVPETNPTRATLFLAANNNEAMRNQMSSRWQAVTVGEVETYTVPGSHYDMLREPHVGILADQLKVAIERAQASIDDSDSQAG